MSNIDKSNVIELRKKLIENEFKRMNDVQREAVFHSKGPLLILAGAGSGKTTVVVNRIAYLVKYGIAYDSEYLNSQFTIEDYENLISAKSSADLDEGTLRRLAVSPTPSWKVMAITFTNKAANELKERLEVILGERANDVWASTFHSGCARILRRDGYKINYTSKFSIYDTADSKALVKKCQTALDISEKFIPSREIISAISKAKDSMISADEYYKLAGYDNRKQKIGEIYKMYQSELRKANAMDFDDLLCNTVKLFKEFPDVLEYYQNRFDYIMVDEYQDTNMVQYEFVRLLADAKKNICVVGDDDQSIYKFRGATIENILNFEVNFEKSKVIRLEQNYRSSGNILKVANEVISNNTWRKGKELWTKSGDGEVVTVVTANNEQDEADKIADKILDGVSAGRSFSDFAVLYRMNAQSQVLERVFSKQGIPHRLLSGTRFYDRAEIKDLLAYLHVVNNPTDTIRFRRIINKPTRGIGAKTLENIDTIASQTGMTYLDVLNTRSQFPMLSKSEKSLAALANLFNELIDIYRDNVSEIDVLYDKILELTNYTGFVYDSEPDKAQVKKENIMELASSIQRYQKECTELEKEASLSEFLEEISLVSDIDNYDEEANAVTLMTIHSAKGLEFPVVFLPGWEENVFPSYAVIQNPDEIEEERRLAYVAVTRAKENLHIYNAVTRMSFGQTSRNQQSRFIAEFPKKAVKFEKPEFSGGYSFGSTPSYNSYYPTKNTQLPNFAKKEPSKLTKNTIDFKEGDTVKHNIFGQGVILSTRPMGNDTLLEVAFDRGTKMLGANFAKLEKIN